MRVMITAGGSSTAQSVIKGLRADYREHFVVIGDMYETSASKAFADAFEVLPPANASNYAERCLDVVRKHGVELLIPLIAELEFPALAPYRKAFEEVGCTLWVPDVDVYRDIIDKLKFAQFLESINVKTPRTLEYSPVLRVDVFPVFLKPRRGYGSLGATYVPDEASLHSAASGRENLIVQNVIEGTEFTVDCFASESGRVVAAIPRERILIKSGVSVKGRTLRHPVMEDVAAQVVAATGVVGPSNVQGFLGADGDFTVIEMNPRFSGTLTLSTAAGINFAALLVDCAEGKQIANLRGKHRGGVTMMRYWQEVFEDSEGRVWCGQDIVRSDVSIT